MFEMKNKIIFAINWIILNLLLLCHSRYSSKSRSNISFYKLKASNKKITWYFFIFIPMIIATIFLLKFLGIQYFEINRVYRIPQVSGLLIVIPLVALMKFGELTFWRNSLAYKKVKSLRSFYFSIQRFWFFLALFILFAALFYSFPKREALKSQGPPESQRLRFAASFVAAKIKVQIRTRNFEL